jgi:hypothetical protein
MMKAPCLLARFELDANGRPQAIRDGGRSHYLIRFEMQDAPADAYAVTYQLHESYYDPVRESKRRDSRFSEELTSYGDFVVRAKIRSPDGVETVSSPLSKALEQGHRDALTPEIQAALRDIREN